MQHLLPLDGGHCNGPLFALQCKQPIAKSTRLPGMRRRSRERRQTPGWAEAAPTRAIYAQAERMTRETGITHSVEHVVPLAGGTVCGLHWHGNMEVRPLRDNLVKGTRWWPDMWEQQLGMFDDDWQETAGDVRADRGGVDEHRRDVGEGVANALQCTQRQGGDGPPAHAAR